MLAVPVVALDVRVDLVGEGVVLIGPMISDQTDCVVNLGVD